MFQAISLLHKSTPMHKAAQCYNYSWWYSSSSHSESTTILPDVHNPATHRELSCWLRWRWFTEEIPNIHQKTELFFCSPYFLLTALHHFAICSSNHAHSSFSFLAGYFLGLCPHLTPWQNYVVSLSSVSCKTCEKLSTKPVAEIKFILFLSLD